MLSWEGLLAEDFGNCVSEVPEACGETLGEGAWVRLLGWLLGWLLGRRQGDYCRGSWEALGKLLGRPLEIIGWLLRVLLGGSWE